MRHHTPFCASASMDCYQFTKTIILISILTTVRCTLGPWDCVWSCNRTCARTTENIFTCYDIDEVNMRNLLKGFDLTTLHLVNVKAEALRSKVVTQFHQLRNLVISNSTVTVEEVMTALTIANQTHGLTGLYIRESGLRTLPDRFLTELPMLVYLHLEDDGLENIPADIFDNLGLYFLCLDDNRIQKIGPNSFTNMTQLNKLYLAGNNISYVDPLAFWNLPVLLKVDLSRNALATIPTTALSSINTTSGLSLNLSFNRIEVVADEIKGLSNLYKIDLSYNRLHYVTPDLALLANLILFYVPGNQLRSIPSTLSVFTEKASRMFLKLEDNPWSCDCDIKWLIEWSQEYGAARQRFVMPNCSTPSNTSFADIPTGNWSCVSGMESTRETEFIQLVFFMIAGMLVVPSIVGVILWRKRRTKPSSKKRMVSNTIYYDEQETTASTEVSARNSTVSQDLPFEEIDSGERVLRIGKIIGLGAFGCVYEGYVVSDGPEEEWTKVAVKKLKDKASDDDILMMTTELDQMVAVGKHPNVINLIGHGNIKGSAMIVMEFAPLGDLLTLLRNKSVKAEDEQNLYHSKSYIFEHHAELILFAWQVAKGMSHLERLKVVHRDIAARNVLLTQGPVAKISDFGLSRDVYEAGYYYMDSKGRLPYKWMSPESLLYGRNNTKSDVWSFGILLWEIVTFGSAPYPGIPPNILIEMHKSGYKMKQSPFCPDEIYCIMSECWEELSERRPTFDSMTRSLDRILQAGCGEVWTIPSSQNYVEILPEKNKELHYTEVCSIPLMADEASFIS